MKKPLLITLTCIGAIISTLSQSIPNYEFENWDERTYFEVPDYDFPFVHTNIYAGGPLGNDATITKVEGASTDSLAIRLETNADSTTGILLLGEVDENDSIVGGFDFNEVVSQLKLVTRYDIKPGDTASVSIIFDTETFRYSFTNHKIIGSQNEFDTLTIDLNPLTAIAVPSKCIIAVFASNADDELVVPHSFIEIDDMWFVETLSGSETRVDIPNGSFEEWEATSFYEPLDWNTSNMFASVPNVTEEQSITGSSVIIESQPLAFGDTNGILFKGLISEEVEKAGFPYMGAPTDITLNYHYTPASPTDTAVIYIAFTSYDKNTQKRTTTGVGRSLLIANTEMETIDIPFYVSGAVDSVAITIASSIDEEDYHKPQMGSKLIIDNLIIDNITGSVNLFNNEASVIYPNPATNRITIADETVKSISVLNNLGQQVAEYENNAQSLNINLESGSYLIQLLDESNNLIKTEKLLVQ